MRIKTLIPSLLALLIIASCSSSMDSRSKRPVKLVYEVPKGCRLLEWVNSRSAVDLTSDEVKRRLLEEASKIKEATHIHIDNISISQGSGYVYSCPI